MWAHVWWSAGGVLTLMFSCVLQKLKSVAEAETDQSEEESQLQHLQRADWVSE